MKTITDLYPYINKYYERTFALNMLLIVSALISTTIPVTYALLLLTAVTGHIVCNFKLWYISHKVFKYNPRHANSKLMELKMSSFATTFVFIVLFITLITMISTTTALDVVFLVLILIGYFCSEVYCATNSLFPNMELSLK